MTVSAESKPVSSSQAGVHPRLEQLVRKHMDRPWHPAMHHPTQNAFLKLIRMMKSQQDFENVILDSGCGTGTSTRKTAALNPQSLVVGIDRSLHRLQKTGHARFPAVESNIIWLQADLPAFWRLAAGEGWRLQRHFLLYPNPYPKAAHLQRRWHGHPVFPLLLSLGGELELRSNWSTYLQEFARAVELVTSFSPTIETLSHPDSGSRFEAKYHRSGHPLFRLVVPREILNQRRNWQSVWL